MSFFEYLPVGRLDVIGGGFLDGETIPSTAGIKVTHKINGSLIKTTITLTDVAQDVVDGTEYQSTLLYTFPKCVMTVLSSASSLAQKTTSDPATTLNASVTGAVALGSVAASAVTLTGTMIDFQPSTAFTSSATQNVAGTAVVGMLAATKPWNGNSTAKSVYLNSAYATTTDVDANATQTWTGTVIITWTLSGAF